MPEPKRTKLRELLDRPDARPRVKQAVARLLGVSILSIGVIGALVIWHLVRRGRLIRDGLRPPRSSRLPDQLFTPEVDHESDSEADALRG
jgi:hypothetical protein